MFKSELTWFGKCPLTYLPQVHYRVLPDDELVLRYNLYPLNAGWVGLPMLRIQSADQSSNLEIENLLTQQLFPSQIFIMVRSTCISVIFLLQN